MHLKFSLPKGKVIYLAEGPRPSLDAEGPRPSLGQTCTGEVTTGGFPVKTNVNLIAEGW